MSSHHKIVWWVECHIQDPCSSVTVWLHTHLNQWASVAHGAAENRPGQWSHVDVIRRCATHYTALRLCLGVCSLAVIMPSVLHTISGCYLSGMWVIMAADFLVYSHVEWIPSVLWCCWFGGRKGIRPVKTEWWGAGMVISLQPCIWSSWCHCHSLSLASVKSWLVLPFWFWLTRVVPEKWPLNGCVRGMTGDELTIRQVDWSPLTYAVHATHAESQINIVMQLCKHLTIQCQAYSDTLESS